MSRKGFFFTLDILFAIVVAMTIIFGIFYFSQKNQRVGNLYAEKVANDILVVLGKNKTLETLNVAQINSSLSYVLPKNLASTLNITVYECSDSQCNGFSRAPSKDINIQFPTDTKETDSVISRRTFLTFESNKIKYFANVELRLWSR